MLATVALAAGPPAVALFGKIDQQIKLLIEGVHKVPERLFQIDGKSIAKRGRIPGLTDSPRLTPVDLATWRDGA